VTVLTADGDPPDVDAFRAISLRDADGAEVRSILDALPTEALARVESNAVRLIWAARAVRQSREKKDA
jgi:hypothetical protein